MHSKQFAKELLTVIRTSRSLFNSTARPETATSAPKGSTSLVRHGLALGMLLFTSCTRAPSFNIVGSFFPAWLVCLIVAVLLTVITGWLLLRLHLPVAVPALTYPGLTASLTFALWLIFFGW
jgi:hypothetical protein